jgi:hypothetical protein
LKTETRRAAFGQAAFFVKSCMKSAEPTYGRASNVRRGGSGANQIAGRAGPADDAPGSRTAAATRQAAGRTRDIGAILAPASDSINTLPELRRCRRHHRCGEGQPEKETHRFLYASGRRLVPGELVGSVRLSASDRTIMLPGHA